MVQKRYPVILAVLALGWFVGCASRPEEAIKQAQKAMDEAAAVQASQFAPGDWKSAQDAWDEAQKALSSQRYGEASGHLMQAKSRFEKARNVARSKRDVMKNEVGTLQGAVNRRFEAVKEVFGSGKIRGKALKELDASYQDLQKSVEEMNTDMLNERFLEAKKKAEGVVLQLNELQKKVAVVDKKLIF
jgi:hypothetical protein